MSSSMALHPGDEGDAVAKLQHRLRILGEAVSSVDGQYGSETVLAVKSFQQRRRMPAPTGICTEETWLAIEHAETGR